MKPQFFPSSDNKSVFLLKKTVGIITHTTERNIQLSQYQHVAVKR